MKLATPRLDKVRWIDLPSTRDDRDVLTSIESIQDTPLLIERIFYMPPAGHHDGGARSRSSLAA